MKLPKRILIATDLSETSREAVVTGAALAKVFAADAMLVSVLDPMPYVAAVDLEGSSDVWRDFLDDAEANLRKQLEELRDGQLDGCGCDVAVLRDSSAARALCEFAADRGVDLIVVGSHGRTGAKRLLLGSVAEKVVRLSPCPVFVVR
ncbi:MAG: universal stress protein UspA [Sandaracinus sp.]|nr:universal stress protein UspA [Sandaracinus sp.]|tara:strand:- start:371 stop:814 length:444 start_codon:yes stop_codon:yes gene_type:complete